MADLNLQLLVGMVNRATAPLRELQQQVGKVRGAAAEADRSLNLRASLDRVTAGAAALGAEAGRALMVVSALGAAAGYGFGRAFLTPAAQFERFETILQTTEGSAAAAGRAMAWVGDFASKTPYELAQVTDAFVKLRAYGLDPTGGLLAALGDTSAAMGKDLTAAVEAMADAVTGENERLKEFGIRASKGAGTIAYEFTDRAGLQRTVRVMAGDRAAIQRALMGIMSERYGGSMDRLSRTWTGVLSNVLDQLTRFAVLVMKSGPFERLKARLQEVLRVLDRLSASGQLQRWAESVGRFFVRGIDDLVRGLVQLVRWLRQAVPMIWPLLERLGPLRALLAGVGLVTVPRLLSPLAQLGGGLLQAAGGVGNLAEALPALRTSLASVGTLLTRIGPALIASPLGWAALALAAGGLLVWRYWRPLKGFFSGFWTGMESSASRKAIVQGLRDIVWPARVYLQILRRLFTPVNDGDKSLVGMGASLGRTFGPMIGLLGGLAKLVWYTFFIVPILAYKAWGPLSQFLSGLWEGFAIALEPILPMLRVVGAEVLRWVGLVQRFVVMIGAWLQRLTGRVFPLGGILRAAGQVAGHLFGRALVNAWRFVQAVLLVGVTVARLIRFLFFAGPSFVAAGYHLVRQVAQGIRRAAHLPVDAMKAVVARVRRLLPYSPAKEGPLADLHRVRLVETIAAAVRPEPLVHGMQRAVGAAVGGPGASGGRGGRGSAPITISYAPVLQLSGGGDEASLRRLLQEHADWLLRALEAAQAKRDRGRY
jgi:hypothetical protein